MWRICVRFKNGRVALLSPEAAEWWIAGGYAVRIAWSEHCAAAD
jgi:hypothetical protein